jgi:hypothetical protein
MQRILWIKIIWNYDAKRSKCAERLDPKRIKKQPHWSTYSVSGQPMGQRAHAQQGTYHPSSLTNKAVR